jgi:hypothetical protein
MTLTASQLQAIERAAYPLQPDQRVAFYAMLERWLADRPAVGDGELYQTLRLLQRECCRYPDKVRHGDRDRARK